MAGLITVRLSRSDAQPWGFRLQGGKDFGAPLLIQKVNGGSLAEKSGLQVADAVIKVNGQDVYNLRHKDAQDVIVKAGNSFEVVISRGPGGTWKPAVSPIGNLPSPSPVSGAPAPVTKTSLAYKGPASPAIGTGHNVAAKPFSYTPQQNGVGDQGGVKSITSKQYNNPVGLYSEQNIAETLSAQAEVLAGGVLGVNFMKNEKTYNSNNSEVLKMVQEIDKEPREPEPVEPVTPGGGMVVSPPASSLGLRHVAAPETKPPSAPSSQQPLQAGQNVCADCERLIVGVFVRIKDKNLHVECFKCATCGTSLKNVGYYNINNKLYCDVHAKLVARSNPPAPNLDPITIPPGGRIPPGAISAQHGADSQSPQPGTLAPLPFHTPTSTFSGPKPFGAPSAAPAPFSTPAAPVSMAAPAPPSSFGPAPAPPPASMPFSSAPPPPSMPSFPKSLPDQNEPSMVTSYPQNEREKHHLKEIEDQICCGDSSKRMSVCSTEVCSLSEKKSATLASLTEDPGRASPVPFNKNQVVSEAFSATSVGQSSKSEKNETSEEGNVHIARKTKVEETFVRSQKMYTAEISSSQVSSQVRASSPEMEQIMTKRQNYQSYHDNTYLTPNTLPASLKTAQPDRCLTPEIENLMDKPHGSWSPMPPACLVRPISPSHIISYPPDMPSIHSNLQPLRTATPEQFQEARETIERFVDHTKEVNKSQTVSSERNVQSFVQQSTLPSYNQQSFEQQYTPKFDSSQGFSAYVSTGSSNNRGNGNNGKFDSSKHGDSSHGSYYTDNIQNPTQHNGVNPQNQANHNNGNPGKGKANGNLGNNGNGKSDHENVSRPTVSQPDSSEGQSSRSEQSQKPSRRTSVSEEETSRRVFSDFGGPQIISSVDVESTTEGGVEKTSVTKSQKMEYSSCEFESSRKSTVKQDSKNIDLCESSGDTGDKKPASSNESQKFSYPTFSSSETKDNEEETVTKSQVEEIIKQELNKVFQMAQTMETTNFGEMYDQSSQQASYKEKSRQISEQKHEQTADIPSKTIKQQPISNQNRETIQYTGKPLTKTGKLTSGLTIAPDRSFTPQPLENNYPLPFQNLPSDTPTPRSHPAPPSSKPSYIPLTGDRSTPFVQALTIASERPFSPLPIPSAVETPSFITVPKGETSSMLSALTTAPSTPFHIQGVSEVSESKTEMSRTSEKKYESTQKYAPRPSHGEFKPIIQSGAGTNNVAENIGSSASSKTCPIKTFQPVADELKSAFKSTSKVQSTTFSESETQQIATSKEIKSQQRSVSASRVERPVTPSGLHPPNLLPYYQQYIGEIPLAHRSNSPVPHQIKAPSITPPRAQSIPPHGERRGSVKAMGEAYIQQVAVLNNQQASQLPSTSSVSYTSSGAYSSGSVSKTYSYEQEHKSIDSMGYHASPLAGKLPLAGEQTLPKCSSPILGKLDHNKQVFKPSIPVQPPVSAFRSSVADQANLRQAPPYFVQEKEKPKAPWVVVTEGSDDVDVSSHKYTQPTSTTQPTSSNKLPFKLSFPPVSKTQPAFPVPSMPVSLPGVTKPPSAIPDAGPGGAPKSGATAGTSAPRRGRGVLNTAVSAGSRVPLCGSCNSQIRGPFITALGKIWCPDHFVCVNAQCRRPLQDIGFVEDAQGLYCEYCFEQYLAPACSKCNAKVKGDCLNAIGKHFHPECFTCAYCGKHFGNSPFFLEDSLPYCEADWNELFTTKCFACGFPIEAGDRWVEALNNNYHSQCFNCTMCKKNLEGQSFFAKGGRPFCKTHAR